MSEQSTQESTQQPGQESPAQEVENQEEQDSLPPAAVTIEDAGAARKRIKIEIPEARIKGKLENAFGELQKDAVLPGFRRGRAPKRLLEKRFGGDMRNTVKQQLVAEAYEQAIEKNELDAIGDPEVDLSKVELPDSGPMTVNVEVEVTPEFALPAIEKIAVKKPKLEANETRQNLALENLRKYFGHWHDSTEPITENDTVATDVKVTATEDNALLAEQPNVSLAVKPGSIAGVRFEDLGEKLKGKSIGDTVTLEGNLPQEHPDEKYRGKPIKVELAIKGVKHQHLPEVNEEFAKMLGFETVDELKNDLKERLVTQLEQETKGAMSQQVYRYLLSNTNLDLPAKLSQRQMGNVLRRRATELMQKGVPESEIVQQIDQLRIASAQQAAVDLRLYFILSKLADQFGIEVSNEEVNARIAAMAMQYGRRPERLRHQLQQSGQMEQLHLQIRDGKVVDKLLETAEITDIDEQALADEFKNLPPLTNVGPNVTGVSHSAPTPGQEKPA
ncbi:MAG TPA: trigger factor [Phycisphaerae bacterium]|nr:trigger factor [Phycisphaerae bacterium]